MNSEELQKLAIHARSTREAGITLIIASGILSISLLIQFATRQQPVPEPVTVAASAAPNAFDNMPIEAKAAVVYDLTNGETLYSKNSDAQLPLASLTKLLTIYAALAELSPNTPIAISESAVSVEGPRTFRAGQIFSLADLARLTLTGSLNDGAAAIAEATALRESRSESEMLASAASALELSQTYAVNGSGLDMGAAISGGNGSARDLARLAGALVERSSSIAAATTQSSVQAVSAGGTHFSIKNTDPMVGTIPRLLLSKTGYTDLAGGNLALVFDAGINHPIAVVVLGSSLKARFTDGAALVSATLAHFAGVASL